MPVIVTSTGPDGQITTETIPDETAAPAPTPEPGDPVAPAPTTPDAPAPTEPGEPAEPSPAPETETGGEEEGTSARQSDRVNRAFARERRERIEAERRAAAAEERARLYAEAYQPEAAPTRQQPQGVPRLEDFETHEEFEAARIDYLVEQRFQAREQQERGRQQARAEQEREQALETRQQAFRAQHPDYDDVLSTHLAGRLHPALLAQLQEDDDGPALAYHVLAREPQLLERLNGLPTAQMARELGRLTARLPAKNGTPPSTTPPPAKPAPLQGVGSGGAPAAPGGYREDMSQAEFDQQFPYRPGRR